MHLYTLFISVGYAHSFRMPDISLRMATVIADGTSTVQAGLSECNCLAIRQAARHVTQFYDQLFAPVGLRATQFAILGRLRRQGAMMINALAKLLVIAPW